VLGGGVEQDRAPGLGEGSSAPPAAPVASVVSKGLLRSRPGDKLMLVRSAAGDAPAVQSIGGSSAHGGLVQGATALKGELAERGLEAIKASTDEAMRFEFSPPELSAHSSLKGSREEARMKGYVGEACPECGNFTMVRSGTCLKCDTCGGTTGCS
jgi:ribonucleoside-diphosphate reductase alpha chain